MTTPYEFAAEFKSRGFKPTSPPLLIPVGRTMLVVADDGQGCALMLFRRPLMRDEFWRVPWWALNKARAS